MEEDIKVIQDSKIAMQTINKMADSGGMNFIYIDNRTADIDNRHLTNKSSQSPQIDIDNDMIPNVVPSNTGHIPGHLLSDLETVISKFPQPRLDHMIKAIFKIAEKYGSNNKERGEWLGIGRGKTQYWRKKLKLGDKG